MPGNIKRRIVAQEMVRRLESVPTTNANRATVTGQLKYWQDVYKKNKPSSAWFQKQQEKILNQVRSGVLSPKDAMSAYSDMMAKLGITGDDLTKVSGYLSKGLDRLYNEQKKTKEWQAEVLPSVQEYSGDESTMAQNLVEIGSALPELQPTIKDVLEGGVGTVWNNEPLTNYWGLNNMEGTTDLIYGRLYKYNPKGLNKLVALYKEKTGNTIEDEYDRYDFIKWIISTPDAKDALTALLKSGRK